MKMDMTAITGYNTRKDYSMLLQNLPSRPGAMGAANLNFLSDYASIKNGSYGRLMNAYYGPDKSRVSGIVNNNSLNSLSTSRDDPKQLKDIQSSAGSLKKSADALLASGATDTDAVYKAVSNFIKDFNNLIDKGNESNTTNITNRINSLTNMANMNSKLLGQVGITVDSDGKLSVKEEDFKKANTTTVKTLFSGAGSFAFQASAQASLIDFAASNEAARSNTYNASGGFSNNFSTGNIFGTFF